MALRTDLEYKGISLTGAYVKGLVSLDVAIYKDQEQRDLNNVLGNKQVNLSEDSWGKIYQIIKDDAYPDATDIL